MSALPGWTIRPSRSDDANAIANVIRTVMTAIGASGPGYAMVDPEVDNIPHAYDRSGAVYFVVERNGEVSGGAGIAPLQAADPGVCELRKMYFIESLRGLGAGRALLRHCLDAARGLGYRQCYLETLPDLHAACHLYEAAGFKRIDSSMGNTGHFSCDRYYLMDL